MKNIKDKLISGLLAAVITFSLFPKISGDDNVRAASIKAYPNTQFGTTQISKPDAPDANKAWSGSYVYFGSYNYEPVRFRVLSPLTTVYGGRTMLLDSDKILFNDVFDTETNSSNVWSNSQLKRKLNVTFFNSSFTPWERLAVSVSKVPGGKVYDKGSFSEYMYGTTTALDDKVFLLDAEEALKPEYGYSADEGVTSKTSGWTGLWQTNLISNRIKRSGDTAVSWWLRSPNKTLPRYAGSVYPEGYMMDRSVSVSQGVAPAMNLDQYSILLSTLISGISGASGAEYKLTVKDSNLDIAVQSGKSVTSIGSSISVPYTVSGSNAGSANRASVLILDKEYKAGNTNNAKTIYYGELTGTYGKTSTGTFNLPSALSVSDWGTKYFVYIMVEDVNGEKETDHASIPVKLSAPSKAKNVWSREGDYWYYYGNDGEKVIGWNLIDKDWYFFGSQGEMLKGWQQDGENWHYLGGNGIMRTGWQDIDGTWYFFGDSGVMRKGWQEVESSWYYFGSNGIMRTGWQLIDGGWYYFGNNGVMRKGWQEIGGKWYYLGDSGVMKTGWQYIGGQWYFFKSNGTMAVSEYIEGCWINSYGTWTYKAKAKWLRDSKGWFYIDSTGWYAKSCTLKIDGKDYKFDGAGYCTNP